LNPHTLRYRNLNPARLPIPPLVLGVREAERGGTGGVQGLLHASCRGALEQRAGGRLAVSPALEVDAGAELGVAVEDSGAEELAAVGAFCAELADPGLGAEREADVEMGSDIVLGIQL
jgi:hypothetical protein